MRTSSIQYLFESLQVKLDQAAENWIIYLLSLLVSTSSFLQDFRMWCRQRSIIVLKSAREVPVASNRGFNPIQLKVEHCLKKSSYLWVELFLGDAVSVPYRWRGGRGGGYKFDGHLPQNGHCWHRVDSWFEVTLKINSNRTKNASWEKNTLNCNLKTPSVLAVPWFLQRTANYLLRLRLHRNTGFPKQYFFHVYKNKIVNMELFLKTSSSMPNGNAKNDWKHIRKYARSVCSSVTLTPKSKNRIQAVEREC